MKHLVLKKIFLLGILVLSGFSIVGCTRTYSSVPRKMHGYYISGYKKSNLATPILFHITKHNATSMFMPYNRKKIAYRAIRNQEIQLYTNGLQNAESKPTGQNVKQILRDRNLLKSMSKNFSTKKSFKSKHFEALEHNLQSKKDIHVSNVKYIHHRYYIKGHMHTIHYYVIHNKLVSKDFHNHTYTVNKFKFNKHHQLGIVIQEPQQHMKVHLFLLHRLSNHTAHIYLHQKQIKS